MNNPLHPSIDGRLPKALDRADLDNLLPAELDRMAYHLDNLAHYVTAMQDGVQNRRPGGNLADAKEADARCATYRAALPAHWLA